jgi:hypothetical protein
MYTQEQLQKLRDAYAKGVLSVELAGEKVTFASGSEMRRRIRDIEGNLTGGGSEMTVSYATTGRGY